MIVDVVVVCESCAIFWFYLDVVEVLFAKLLRGRRSAFWSERVMRLQTKVHRLQISDLSEMCRRELQVVFRHVASSMSS